MPILPPLLIALSLLLASPLAAKEILSAPEAHHAATQGQMLLVDIRTPREWQQTGVAADALRIDYARGINYLASELLKAVDGNKSHPILLICRTGNRTARAQAQLKALGFSQIYHVKEGMAGSSAGPGWIARGLPIERCISC
jgi:rhodanese-related sulfurtransferase